MLKKNKKLSEISIKDVYNYFIDQRYKYRKVVEDFSKLPEKIFEEMDPVFVVSTGRAGSELLVKLFKAAGLKSVYHEPHPRMFLGSKMSYELCVENIEIKKMVYLNARYDLIKMTYLQNERLIETNNRLTFFLDSLAYLFPRAKFIHLIRHPGAFVRSGIRRKYYRGNENDDGRMTPLADDPIYNLWDEFNDIEKIGWLWNETNSIIEIVKKTMGRERILTVLSENLFSMPDIFQEICRFIDHPELKENKIERIIKEPVNLQKQGEFPMWNDWSEYDQNKLRSFTPLGKKYGFWK